MVLTDIQRAIIDQHPELSNLAVSRMAHCDDKTVAKYRKSVNTDTTETPTVRKSDKPVRARATNTKVGNPNVDEGAALNSDQLNIMQSVFCVSEFNLYQEYTLRLQEKPNDIPTMMAQKQHADLLQKGLFLMGKWLGKDKTVVDMNITAIRKITPEDLENMSLNELLTTVDVCNRNKT